MTKTMSGKVPGLVMMTPGDFLHEWVRQGGAASSGDMTSRAWIFASGRAYNTKIP
jgi:hypothetical protein